MDIESSLKLSPPTTKNHDKSIASTVWAFLVDYADRGMDIVGFGTLMCGCGGVLVALTAGDVAYILFFFCRRSKSFRSRTRESEPWNMVWRSLFCGLHSGFLGLQVYDESDYPVFSYWQLRYKVAIVSDFACHGIINSWCHHSRALMLPHHICCFGFVHSCKWKCVQKMLEFLHSGKHTKVYVHYALSHPRSELWRVCSCIKKEEKIGRADLRPEDPRSTSDNLKSQYAGIFMNADG